MQPCECKCACLCVCVCIQMCTAACFHGKHWREINSTSLAASTPGFVVTDHTPDHKQQVGTCVRPPCMCVCVSVLKHCRIDCLATPACKEINNPLQTHRRAREHTHHRQEDTLPHSCVGDERESGRISLPPYFLVVAGGVMGHKINTGWEVASCTM